MPNNNPAPVHRYVFAVVLALAAALAFVILISLMRFFYFQPNSEEVYVDPDKQEILDQLSSLPDTPAEEKQSIVDGLVEAEADTEADMSAAEKFQILNNLNAR